MEEDGSPPPLPPLARPVQAKFAQFIDGRNTVVFETEQAPAQHTHTQSAVVGRWTTSSPAAQGGMNTHQIGPGCLDGFNGVNEAPVLCACASPAVGFGFNNNRFGVCQPSGAFTPAAMHSPGSGAQAAVHAAFSPCCSSHEQQCGTTFGSPHPSQPLHAPRTAGRSSHPGVGYVSGGGVPVHNAARSPLKPAGAFLPVPLPAGMPAGMQSHTVNSTTDSTASNDHGPRQARTGLNTMNPKPIKHRTPEEISSGERAQHDVRAAQETARAHGFPQGPLAGLNSDGLLEAVKKVCINKLEGGGGWGANKCRVTAGNTAHGTRLSFGCHHRGHTSVAGLGCRWEITYEQSTDGWVLYQYQGCHNVCDGDPPIHTLDKDLAQTMAYSSGRVFDSLLIPLGHTLQKTDFSPTQIFEALQTHAKEHGLSTNFNMEDVRTRFPQSVRERDYDATGLVEFLGERESNLGMKYYVKTDQSGHINRVFVQMDNSKEEYAAGGEHNVVMFDPTAGTNRYGLKLCCFTTVGSTGQTVILAFSLLKYEDEEQIEWAFRCFSEIFRVAPATLLTDGAASIEAAFNACAGVGDVFEHCIHQLCVFHIWKNFYQHVHPILMGNQDIWRKVCHMFWRLAKISDGAFASAEDFDKYSIERSTCEVTFDEYWDKMVNMVKEHANGTTVDLAIVWLLKLYEIRQKWAACFTWGVLTWGLHSTQRSEAIHSAIKRRRRLVGFHMVRLVEKLTEYNSSTRLSKSVDDIRSSLRHFAEAALQDPEIQDIQEKITPYAYDLLKAQASQTLRYQYVDEIAGQYEGADVYFVRPADNVAPLREEQAFAFEEDGAPCNFGHYDDFGIGDQAKVIGHWTTVNWCSCQFHSSYAIPCRHTLMLRIRLSERGQRVQLLQLIGNKWHRVDHMLQAQQMLRMSSATAFQRASVRMTFTREERYSKLLDEMRGLAELGCFSMQTFNVALAEIPKLAQAISGSHPPEVATAAAASSAAMHTTSQPAVPRAEVPRTNSAAAPAHEQVARRTPDYVDFLAQVGTRFELAQMPSKQAMKNMSHEGRALVGSYVASKWAEKSKKGWMVGRIETQLPIPDSSNCGEPDSSDSSSDLLEPENFCIKYTDGYAIEILLSLEDYCKDVTANNGLDTWVLLQQTSLGDDVVQMSQDGNLHNPQHFKATGKGSRGKRLEPGQGGPTARKYKKKAKSSKIN